MTSKDLMPFCSEDTEKRNINQPWSAGDFSYATDGRVIVKVSRLDDVPENDSAPAADKVFPKEHAVSWHPVPDCSLPEAEICPVCSGKAIDVECRECHGSGTVDFSNRWSEYECECHTCDGNGEMAVCDECEGTGKVIPVQGIEILPGIGFQPYLLKKLAALPNCKIGPVSETQPAWLEFDGGIGLIMPVGPHCYNRKSI